MAQAILFLASDKASYVTGQSWGVDGGRLAILIGRVLASRLRARRRLCGAGAASLRCPEGLSSNAIHLHTPS